MDDVDYSKTFSRELPAAVRKAGVKIVTPTLALPHTGLIVSQAILGTWSHFRKGTSYPCCADPRLCPFSHGQTDPRWKGYLAVVEYPSFRRRHFELTPYSVNNCPELRDKNGQLRGLEITVRRLKNRDNGPIGAEVKTPSTLMQKTKLPEEWDMEDLLLRGWGNPAEFLRINGGKESAAGKWRIMPGVYEMKEGAS